MLDIRDMGHNYTEHVMGRDIAAAELDPLAMRTSGLLVRSPNVATTKAPLSRSCLPIL